MCRYLIQPAALFAASVSSTAESFLFLLCHALRHKQEMCRYLIQPAALFAASVSSTAVTIQGKEGQKKVRHELADIESNGPIHRKLCIDGIGCVLGDHETACVHVPMQQRLPALYELSLHKHEKEVDKLQSACGK